MLGRELPLPTGEHVAAVLGGIAAQKNALCLATEDLITQNISKNDHALSVVRNAT